MSNKKTPRLMIPGPVDVRPEILEAQAQVMIGHRGKGFEELFARSTTKRAQVSPIRLQKSAQSSVN